MSNEQLPEEVMKAIRDFVDNIRGSYTYGEVFWAASFGYRLRDEEVRRLREALEGLLDAIPKETLDADWWDDSLKNAVNVARTSLQQTSKTENNG